MYDTKELSLKKINFVLGKEKKVVEASMKTVLEKTLAEILPEKKYLYPEDKEAYLQMILQKLVPKASDDDKT